MVRATAALSESSPEAGTLAAMTRLLFLASAALILGACISQSNRRCDSTDGSTCTAYTGITWTNDNVRDACSRSSGTVAAGSSCPASPYGTCVLLEGGITETRVSTYTPGATEAIVETGCCTGASSAGVSATWISASGARRPCPTAGGIDEGI